MHRADNFSAHIYHEFVYFCQAVSEAAGAEQGTGTFPDPPFCPIGHSMDFSDSAISTFRSLGRINQVISSVNSRVKAKENP